AVERTIGRELGGGGVLVLADARQGDAGDLVGGLDEPGAVEADAGCFATPDVGGADLGEGPVDGDASGRAGGDGLGLGLTVGAGEVEDLGHVGVGVVVGEDGGVQVGAVGGPVGAEHLGGGVDRVRCVIRAGRVGATGREWLVVLGERGRFELHGTLSPGRVGARVDTGEVRGAVPRLDGADGGEHRPRQARTGGGGL